MRSGAERSLRPRPFCPGWGSRTPVHRRSPYSSPVSTRPGGGKPLMEDVARLAGVSRGTVSNVLNNPSLVSPAKRERVEQAIEQLGFVRNQAALALAAGRTRTIGYVATDLSNSFFLDVARGIEEEADARGYRMLLANSAVEPEKQQAYLQLLDESRLAGAIVAPVQGAFDQAELLREHGMRVALFNRAASDGNSCSVVADEELAGFLAARHLLDIGRRRILFAGGPMILDAVAARLRGAQRAVAEQGGGALLEVRETQELQIGQGVELGRELA